ncbi:MAG: DUF1501 domain-containing protein [Planctomycetes bacterium]|nr:DUF1501 domain-containing protein [Planctomycetota bacterium]
MILDPVLSDPPALTRRQFLGSGVALGAFVLPTTGQTEAVAPVRRRAKGIIVLLLEGGMSHLESWDPKPAAPEQIRGEFKAIPTTRAGLRIGEHLPLLAQQARLYNLLRSVHCDARNDHSPGLHLALTGHENTEAGVSMQRVNLHHPAQGAILARLLGVMTPGGVPRFVALPKRTQLGGQVCYASPAFLGAACEAFEAGDLPLTATLPMRAPPGLLLPGDVDLRRLQDRSALKGVLDRLNRGPDRDPAWGRMDAHYQRARQLLTGPRMLRALDISREPVTVRERFGNSPVGQGLVVARRLVEAGVTYVLVNPYSGAPWDTHTQNFTGHKRLLPPLDRAVAALLTDLDQRGMLEDILVLVISEMGRTPLVNKQAGRDHWTAAYSVMMAGGGLTRGQVVGSTTSGGQEPSSRPVTVSEILATVYHQLGVDSGVVVYDQQQRPVPILPEAKPVSELIA